MSLKRKSVQHGMQGVFVFVLLGAFAVMSTLMVLLGAQMYHATVGSASANNDDRVLSAYVRSMVRAQDRAGAIRVEELDGLAVLSMTEYYGDDAYVTRLYRYDGSLCEQFTGAEYDFDPALGDAICPAGKFEPELTDGLLTISMTDGEGKDCVVRVALRTSQDAQ